MKVFIYNQDNGRAAVCFPTGDLSLAEMRGRDFPEDAVMINKEELPMADFDFRDAWEVVSGSIETNIAKASDIAKDKIREMRGSKFAIADQEMLLAIEKGESLVTVAAKKTALRDFPERIDSAPTLPAMKSLINQFEAL